MSEQEQQTNQPVSNELTERVKNAYFSKECTILYKGVMINAQKDEKSVDIIINNEDVADIFNAINEDVPFDNEDQKTEKSNELGDKVSSDNSESNEL